MLKAIIAALLVGQSAIALGGSGYGSTRHASDRAGAAGYAAEGADGVYPDPKLTPGEVDRNATAKVVCKDGYTAAVRDVTDVTKRKVFAEYSIDWAKRADYEVDHFVSLELGGTNDLENLWPEPYAGAYTARMKDQVENWLHRQVCAGKMSLATAQGSIRRDWVAVYDQCCKGQGK